MSRSEDLLISAVLRNTHSVGRGINEAARLGVTDALFLQRKAQWMWLNGHRGADRLAFKNQFPNFRIYAVDPTELELLFEQTLRTRADYELGKMFERMMRKLGRAAPTDLAAEIENECRKVMALYSKGEDVDIINDWQVAYRHVKHAHDQVAAGQSIGYQFGIPTLDKLTGGMQAPDLITIVARQGEFKTWMSLFFATQAVIGGAKVMYASLEMTPAQIAMRVNTLLSRMLANSAKEQFKSNFSNMGLMMGAVDLKEYKRWLLRARNHLSTNFIVPSTKGGFNMGSMVAKVEKHQPNIAFFDYFGLGMGSTSRGSGENWVQAVQTSHMAKHDIATQFDIPFVLNAQANRKGVDAQDAPELDHIGLTDALGADSDQVLSLRLRAGELKMVVKKNRRGRSGDTIKFDLDIDNGVLKEISSGRVRSRPSDEESED